MKIVALSGGVGGARLIDGLARAPGGAQLTVVVNTGDDFVHLGLHVAPDLDTVMYTLAELGDEERGWGLRDETFGALSMVRRYGAADWFALGDRDLATHLVRTEAMRAGATLTEITARLCGALAVGTPVLPMCDAPRPTMIDTVAEGTLSFQDWLVRRRAEPQVRAVRFEGTGAVPAPGVLEAIDAADAVVIGPSNPYVSIDPILALDGVREAIGRKEVIAVSPIVGGRAVKGPLAEMILSLGQEPASAGAIARHYRGLITGLVVERGDEASVAEGTRVLGTDTVMKTRDDRVRLAGEVLGLAAELAR